MDRPRVGPFAQASSLDAAGDDGVASSSGLGGSAPSGRPVLGRLVEGSPHREASPREGNRPSAAVSSSRFSPVYGAAATPRTLIHNLTSLAESAAKTVADDAERRSDRMHQRLNESSFVGEGWERPAETSVGATQQLASSRAATTLHTPSMDLPSSPSKGAGL